MTDAFVVLIIFYIVISKAFEIAHNFAPIVFLLLTKKIFSSFYESKDFSLQQIAASAQLTLFFDPFVYITSRA